MIIKFFFKFFIFIGIFATLIYFSLNINLKITLESSRFFFISEYGFSCIFIFAILIFFTGVYVDKIYNFFKNLSQGK